ncbi:MAG TPA: 16S rRNA (adenine(1518)-N(6)/adenine(1519)-N(6))-dimethyltransferase RsmA [Streptosporangiaceae bacterium]|nr:16S rRNA (adenine(1518)-N(6)/adenine(1519)-N(6))-dimethyltransferase RsmA [Streptosporangiaceae bacterium]
MDQALPGLLGPADVRELAAKLGLKPAKRLGQNFVIDRGTIRRIVALAKLSEDDVVLEVGPGLGSLTLGLLEAAGRVTAIEVDEALAAQLPLTVAGRAAPLAGQLTVVTGDAVTIGAVPDPQPTALVANLPYNVAVPIMLNLLDVLPTISRALVMVQAEVADRICAPPGSRTYGIPSVKLAWHGSARRVGTISRTVFWPVPNVDSALVSFARWPVPGGGPTLPQASRAAVFEVVDAAFAQRRKTLRAALASWAGSADAAEAVLRAAGVDPALRGEAIGVTQYIQIAQAAASARSIIESWHK